MQHAVVHCTLRCHVTPDGTTSLSWSDLQAEPRKVCKAALLYICRSQTRKTRVLHALR